MEGKNMATNSEEFQKHAKENASIYATAIRNNRITKEDFQAAANVGGKYSFADQDAALRRIHDAFGEFASEHPDDERVQNFVSGIPTVKSFTPNKEDWMSYDNEQMARLAEQMKFNWKNIDDRSEMMKMLTDEGIKHSKQQVYQDYKKEHPAAAWINETILAPNVSNRAKRGEDIKGKDVALDVANIGTYAFPGAGAAASKAGKIALLASDAALQGAVGLASDINQGNKLGMHNVVAPLIGAGTGMSAELVPKLAKTAVDAVTGGFGGEIGKTASDAAEKWITKVFGDEVGAARSSLARDAKYVRDNVKTARKNASENAKKKLLSEGYSAKPNADMKSITRQKEYFASNPSKWKAAIESGRISKEKAEEFLADPRFTTAIRNNAKTYPSIKDLFKDYFDKTTRKDALKETGSQMLRGISRQTGKGLMIGRSNDDRNKNAKPSLDEVIASPEMANYMRLRQLGYDADLPDEYKDYKSRIETLYGF